MKVQNSCVPTSGRRADNDLNLRHRQIQPNRTHRPTLTRHPLDTIQPQAIRSINDAVTKMRPGSITAGARQSQPGLAR